MSWAEAQEEGETFWDTRTSHHRTLAWESLLNITSSTSMFTPYTCQGPFTRHEPVVSICFAANALAEQLTRYTLAVDEVRSYAQFLQAKEAENCATHLCSLITMTINHDKQRRELFESFFALQLSFSVALFRS